METPITLHCCTPDQLCIFISNSYTQTTQIATNEINSSNKKHSTAKNVCVCVCKLLYLRSTSNFYAILNSLSVVLTIAPSSPRSLMFVPLPHLLFVNSVCARALSWSIVGNHECCSNSGESRHIPELISALSFAQTTARSASCQVDVKYLSRPVRR